MLATAGIAEVEVHAVTTATTGKAPRSAASTTAAARSFRSPRL